MPTSAGRKVALRDFKGKDVIVYFYPRDDTPGCTKEAQGFRDLHGALSRRGVVVLGVSPDDEVKHRKFIDKYDLNFTLLCDPEKKVMTEYGAFGKKMMYGKEVTGIIRSTVVIGPDGTVIKHWKKVPKAATHPEKVLEFLQSLQA